MDSEDNLFQSAISYSENVLAEHDAETAAEDDVDTAADEVDDTSLPSLTRSDFSAAVRKMHVHQAKADDDSKSLSLSAETNTQATSSGRKKNVPKKRVLPPQIYNANESSEEKFAMKMNPDEGGEEFFVTYKSDLDDDCSEVENSGSGSDTEIEVDLSRVKTEPDWSSDVHDDSEMGAGEANEFVTETEVKMENSEGVDKAIAAAAMSGTVFTISKSTPPKLKKEPGHRSLAQTLTCGYCWKEFPRSSRLIVHLRSHTGERPYVCSVCGAAFTRGSNLNTHFKIHTGERNHQCNLCDKKFMRASTLTRHMLSHFDERSYQCKICGSLFKQSGDLYRHSLTHSEQRSHSCEICGQGFKVKGTLTRHMKTHSDAKNYPCPICGRLFKFSASLYRHVKSHGEKSHVCWCGTAFHTAGELTVHNRIHLGIKKYECDVCHAKFTRSTNLKAHKFTHSKGRNFKCDECDATFIQPSGLSKHRKKKHGTVDVIKMSSSSMDDNNSNNSDHTDDDDDEEEKKCLDDSTAIQDGTDEAPQQPPSPQDTHDLSKKFECDVCQATFSRGNNLRAHKFIHSTVRNFKCEDCESTFIQPSGLSKHRRKVHGKMSVPAKRSLSDDLPTMVDF